jgi:Iron-containing redox enzyme
MEQVLNEVERAQRIFHEDLMCIAATGGLTREIYVRYLSFQHHLTRGVQRHFLAIVGHPTLIGRRKLRDFLYRFAIEEEPHYQIAADDLRALGTTPLAAPLDVRLWHAYFESILATRPFVRLGATCVLENLGAGAGELGHRLLESAAFLNDRNTRFLQIHFHEDLPHGAQIVDALTATDLTPQELDDLVEGARSGAVLYLRMARWALELPDVSRLFDIDRRPTNDRRFA